MPILHREACSMETDQYLRHCFLSVPPRQGRSLWLPTLPYQRTNRYAVDGAKLVFYLLYPHIGHTNHPMVVSTTPLICAWAVMSCLLSQIIYIIKVCRCLEGNVICW